MLRRFAFELDIRARLITLTVMTALPLVAVLLLGAAGEREQVLHAAQARALELARLGAEQEDDSIQEARVLLHVLARVPAVGTMTPQACHRVLADVSADHPRVGVISVARMNGTLACSSVSDAPTWSVANRPWFQRARTMEPGGLLLSDLVIGRGTGRPTVIAATRLGNGDGPGSDGVIAAGLELSWFSGLARKISHDRSDVVLLIDRRDGAVLARYPDPTAWVGRRFPDQPLTRAVRQHPRGGVVEVADYDGGTLRIVGFAPLPGGEAAMMMAVALDRSVVLAQANARLQLGLALALLAGILAAGSAWMFADLSQLRPIRALAGTAERLGTGHLDDRVLLPAWQAPEFRALGRVLNDMAARLASGQAELARSETLHRVLAENSSDLITRMDLEGRRLYVSPSVRGLLGWVPEDLIGQRWGEIAHPDDRAEVERALAALREGAEHMTWQVRVSHKDGSWLWVESRLALVRDPISGAPESIVSNTRDVTSRKATEDALASTADRLKALAVTDALTGLANRRAFDDALEREWRRSRQEETPLALLMIDADHFKALNDRYGHQQGDRCLRAIARAIRERVRRSGDLAARYGGEEFAALLPRTEAATAFDLGQEIRRAVLALHLEHRASPSGQVSVSIGLACLIPREDMSAVTLLVAADAALYAAKRRGRNRLEVWEPGERGERPAHPQGAGPERPAAFVQTVARS